MDVSKVAVQAQAQAQVQKMKELKEKLSSPLQLVLLLDTTGSMRSEMVKCRTNLSTMVAGMQKMLLGNMKAKGIAIENDLQIAFIPYKDKSADGVPNAGHLEGYHDFSKDTKSVADAIDKCKASGGGGDGPEDLRGGLEKALDGLSWSDDPRAMKVICIITDAPCHGRKFHDRKGARGDNFPEDSDNMLATLQRLIDNRITLLMSAVDKPATAKMSGAFKEFYRANTVPRGAEGNVMGSGCTCVEFDLNRDITDAGFQKQIIMALKGAYFDRLDDVTKRMLLGERPMPGPPDQQPATKRPRQSTDEKPGEEPAGLPDQEPATKRPCLSTKEKPGEEPSGFMTKVIFGGSLIAAGLGVALFAVQSGA